jgi:hypothetical protein
MGRWSFRAPLANLAVVLLGGLCLIGAGGVPTGAVFVTTLPGGADVWLDGTYVGRSPVVVDALTTGAHHVLLNRTGWSSQDVPVVVAASQTQTLSIVLIRQGPIPGATGSIALHSDGGAAIAAVDGEAVTPAKDGTVAVTPGTHDVAFTTARGRMTRTVTVYPDTRTDVVLRGDASARSVVIAPADDYLPAGAYRLDGTRLTVHYKAHTVVARVGERTYVIDGQSTGYDSAPTVIANRIYLPLELLTLLTANDSK